MIPRTQWEIYLGEESNGQLVAVVGSFADARRAAEDGVRATGKTHAIVKVTRQVDGIVRLPR